MDEDTQKRLDELLAPLDELRERWKDLPPGSYILKPSADAPPLMPPSEWTPHMRKVFKNLFGYEPE